MAEPTGARASRSAGEPKRVLASNVDDPRFRAEPADEQAAAWTGRRALAANRLQPLEEVRADLSWPAGWLSAIAGGLRIAFDAVARLLGH